MTRVFDSLLVKARATIKAKLKEMEGEDCDLSSVDAVIFSDQDDLLPERIDAAWCRAVFEERPSLLDIDIGGGSLGDSIREAVQDLVLEELEQEMLDYAREVGLLPSGTPTP